MEHAYQTLSKQLVIFSVPRGSSCCPIFVSLFFTGIILTIGIMIDTMFQLIFYHCIFIQLSYYLLKLNKMENK
jgi:hypothetical protein